MPKPSARLRLLAAVPVALALAAPGRAAPPPAALPKTPQAAPPLPPAFAGPRPASFADLAAALLPAVVNISSSETLKAGAGDDDAGPDNGGNGGNGGGGNEQSPFPPGSPFEKFFHDYMNRQHDKSGGNNGGGGGTDSPDDDDGDNGGDQGPRRMQSLGSGFIIDPAGIVVTNNHVIAGADEITVTLQDNTVLKAKLIGHDDRTDLALLQVKTDRKLPAVAFGDSDKARVGDWVLAIGNPFGLGGTVTAGIVSARGRDIQQGPYDDFIQTDAPINRGNSGGPLFDMDGRVVGINTAIYSPSGGSIGIGFSIPSNEAKLVVDQLRRYGRARRGWIGVRVQAVTDDIAESLKLPSTDGALVAGLDAKGPAANAKLRNGDVILSFDGTPIRSMRTLPRMVAETEIGTEVPLTVWRDGKQQTLHLKVAELPDDAAKPETPPKPAAAKPGPEGAAIAGLGFTLAPIDETLRRKYAIPAGQAGAVVTAVAKDGVASDRGIKPGDVVVQVEQKDVGKPADVDRAVAVARAARHGSVLILVLDKDGQRWVPVPLAPPSPPARSGTNDERRKRP